MHIVVCVKQVPDSAQIRVHPVTNTIMRQGVPAIVNPYDLFALEQALLLRDQFGGEVTVLTMGPPMAEDALRKTMTIGADRAVLLTDRQFAGSDTLATSFALASALRRVGSTWGDPSIVLTGKQTIDGDTAQVGPGIAKRLGLTQLTYVSRIVDLDAPTGKIVVERRAEGGTQVLQSRLPVLITMLEGTHEVRRGGIGDALRAAAAEVVRWSAADAGVEDTSKCGLRGSPTIVKSVYAPPARAEKAKQVPPAGCSADQLASAVLAEIFTHRPHLEAELAAPAR
jgi:electron transfer flavoprotein beta subunit